MDRIKFLKETLVKIDGIPFKLEADTILLGNAKNLCLITNKDFFAIDRDSKEKK